MFCHEIITFALRMPQSRGRMSRESDFDKLFRDYYEMLYRFVHQFISGEDDCHDIVTAVYEDAWRNAAALDLATARGYLFSIARNRTIDFLRRQRKHSAYVAYAATMSERYASADRLAERQHREAVVASVLHTIGPPASDVLRACYVDGKKYKEVAAEMGMSVASVKKHMVKALKMIREIKKTLKQ